MAADIDEIVRLVRLPGWHDTLAGEREIKKALRKANEELEQRRGMMLHWARATGGLGLEAFMKPITIQRITREGLDALRPTVEALAAIEGRLKVPFLYDRNAMALYEIDPAAVEASVPEKRMSYSLVLRRVLSQAKLEYELRVDEADKPFVWITSIKPAP